jgi:acetyl-CoA carboxylase biotin carboxyl carrier protein
VFKIGEIRELIRLMDETSVAELRIETEDMKLHMKKPGTNVQPGLQAAPATAFVTPSPVATSVAQAAPATAVTGQPLANAPELVVEEANVHVIKSPMVGTFYRAPSPELPSFVDKGSAVQEKTIVCIVEAMKLMNEIEAEVTGEVVDVLVQNGQLVEYGQPLFKIKLA